ncbi:MAG TPA: hypothetical protein VD706_03305 [Candidatus Saccharimonadales bacterium]|nr:hypothetical protein [Candidatus Saccharimonadales bacterium]
MTSAIAERWKNPAVVDVFARHHYAGPHLEEPAFHHYPHARLTRHIADILAVTAARNGAKIEADVLPVAAAYHDAGAALWPAMRHAFAIPEDLAADIAARDLPTLHMPEAKVESAKETIRETSRLVPCTTDTARCLSQADLMAGGLLSHDAVFLHGTYRLYKESKQLEDRPLPDDRDVLRDELLEFGVASHETLSTYLEEDLALGPHQRNQRGQSMFNILGARKIRLLERAQFARILEVNLDYITDSSLESRQL